MKITKDIIRLVLSKVIFCGLCVFVIFVGCGQSSSPKSVSNSNPDDAKQKARNAFNNKLQEYTTYQVKEWQEKGRDIKLIKAEFSENKGDIHFDDRPERTTNKYIATEKGRKRFLEISAEANLPAGLFHIIETENNSLLKDFKLYVHLNDGSVWLCTADDIKNIVNLSKAPAEQWEKHFKDSDYNLWAMYYRKAN